MRRKAPVACARGSFHAAWLTACGIGLAIAGSLGGCDSEADRLQRIYTQASTSPAAASGTLQTEWTADRVTLNEALNLAHNSLDTAPGPASLAYAAAVLDAVAALQGPIGKKGVNEFFWLRVGTLAGKAAAVAYAGGDVPGARALVLAPPTRWQTEAFWRQHPSHDALASYILHASGEGAVALARLRERGDLGEETQRAYDEISPAMSQDRRAPPSN